MHGVCDCTVVGSMHKFLYIIFKYISLFVVFNSWPLSNEIVLSVKQNGFLSIFLKQPTGTDCANRFFSLFVLRVTSSKVIMHPGGFTLDNITLHKAGDLYRIFSLHN